MIQRIQSIFLFLTSISFWGLFGLPLANSDIEMAGLFSDQLYNIFDNPILIALATIGGILAIATIFLFKNRPLQKKLNYVNITLAILFIIVALLLVIQDTDSGVNGDISEGYGLGLPIFVIIFSLFTNRYINKDDKLVKSMDRLR